MYVCVSFFHSLLSCEAEGRRQPKNQEKGKKKQPCHQHHSTMGISACLCVRVYVCVCVCLPTIHDSCSFLRVHAHHSLLCCSSSSINAPLPLRTYTPSMRDTYYVLRVYIHYTYYFCITPCVIIYIHLSFSRLVQLGHAPWPLPRRCQYLLSPHLNLKYSSFSSMCMRLCVILCVAMCAISKGMVTCLPRIGSATAVVG